MGTWAPLYWATYMEDEMKTACFKMVQLAAVMALGLSLTACDNAIFSSSSSDKVTTTGNEDPTTDPDDLTFLDDSFERDDIFIDIANSMIYGWRGLVQDGAVDVLGFQSNGAGASIPAAGALGPAFDGQRFLLLTGRNNGAPVETVHVISQTYDLSQYNTVILSFRYLTFGLNDADDTVPEKLEVQVCRGSLNDCGANDDAPSVAGLKSNNWVTVFTNDQTVNDDALNGKNHVLADWKTGLVAIDLRDKEIVGDGSTFVFRFVGTMRDGYKPGTPGTPGSGDDKCDKYDRYGNQRSPATLHAGDDSDCQDNYGHPCHHKDCKDHKHCSHHTHCTHSKDHKHCKHDKNCEHKYCHHHHHRCCHHDDGTLEVPADGTLDDGIAIDKVVGTASPRTIEEIF
jgi:hypothetical protein